MKQILFTLFSLICGVAYSQPLNSGGNNIIYSPGRYGVIADSTPTFALNAVTSTVLSSAVDLSSTGGIIVCITGTAGTSPLVQVSYSNLTYSTFINGPFNLGAGCWPVENVGRYVKFKSVGASLTAQTTLNYYVLSNPATVVTVGNTITVTGNVSVTTGTLTTAGNVSLNAGTSVIGAVGVTSTTMPSWGIVYNADVTINAPTVINLTATAGTSGIMKYALGSSNSNSAGFYWGYAADATWAPPRYFYSTSTTAFIDDYLSAGTHLDLSPASATDISNTAKLIIWKLSQVVP